MNKIESEDVKDKEIKLNIIQINKFKKVDVINSVKSILFQLIVYKTHNIHLNAKI